MTTKIRMIDLEETADGMVLVEFNAVLPDLETKRCLFPADLLFGLAHAYGEIVPPEDTDYKNVAIVTAEDVLDDEEDDGIPETATEPITGEEDNGTSKIMTQRIVDAGMRGSRPASQQPEKEEPEEDDEDDEDEEEDE